MHADTGHWRDLARGIVGGQRCLVATTALAAATPLVRLLKELGAERPFVVAASEGTGELPDPDAAEWRTLGVRERDFISEIRTLERVLMDLPMEVIDAIDRWDPDRTAIAVGTIFTPPGRIAGRPALGGRRPEWAALEDKTVCDEIWDVAGVERLPSEVVPAHPDALAKASGRLDRGLGAVWSGDSREGHQGGAFYVRWVRDPSGAAEAAAFLAAHCDRVRVMPFAEGIPCSIHGFVVGDEVAVFRPCELVTLRRTGSCDLVYAGVATFWDPPDEDRAEMRGIARGVGAWLAERVGYRGAFCVDGIMTEDGFRPTELNARMSAGLNVLARCVVGLPLLLIVKAVEHGLELEYRTQDLEELMVAHTDANRGGGAWTPVTQHLASTQDRPLVWQQGEYRLASSDEEREAVLVSGPSGSGGLVRFVPEPKWTPIGPSIAPRVVAAYALADRLLDTDLGPLEPPRPVR